MYPGSLDNAINIDRFLHIFTCKEIKKSVIYIYMCVFHSFANMYITSFAFCQTRKENIKRIPTRVNIHGEITRFSSIYKRFFP